MRAVNASCSSLKNLGIPYFRDNQARQPLLHLAEPLFFILLFAFSNSAVFNAYQEVRQFLYSFFISTRK
jgi:hypothetical protein